MTDQELSVYIKIHNQMREQIKQGLWKEGQKIPSERNLADRYNVSRMTARAAINSLVADGILERRVGSGTYVSVSKIKEKLNGLASFTETVEKLGKQPSSKLVAYYTKNANSSEVDKLQLQAGEKVLVLERVRYADQVPICYEQASIPNRIADQLSKENITSHLYQSLEEEGILQVAYADQTISASWANEAVADMLEINRGDAILSLRQVTYSQEGQAFEYVRSKYVGDRYEMVIRSSK
ncbi:GntR family transcriptional regulator [Alloiococcus otitis]|uniref:GntR family transcriptional regulator n=1 Tax=Alloiococcus otitis TaxID=1652 RepID=UPI002356E5C1|nr:GntR family transcriptional regulator [Alloiococcus otitis]